MIFGLIEDGVVVRLLEVDAAITESYSSTCQVTQNPIEDGSQIADHVVQNPDVATIDGIHSNDPPIIGAALRVSPDRAETLDAEFVKAKESGQIFDISTSLVTLVGYVITDYQRTRDAASANGLRFQMTVQKLKTVASSKVGEAPRPLIDRAYPMVAIGRLADRRANQAVTAVVGAALIALGNADVL